MVRSKDAFDSAMRALVAMDEPLRRRIADAVLCLVCWDALHSGDELPPDVRDWLDETKKKIAGVENSGPLSDKIRRWADALGPEEARDAALRFVEAFAEVAQVTGL